jgi:hypothetical protein
MYFLSLQLLISSKQLAFLSGMRKGGSLQYSLTISRKTLPIKKERSAEIKRQCKQGNKS